MGACAWVCVCVCVRERERVSERERDSFEIANQVRTVFIAKEREKNPARKKVLNSF